MPYNTTLLITLIIAVALEAAVIVALVVRLRRPSPRVVHEEIMPWQIEESR